MSLATWKKQFYPISARAAVRAGQSAVAHSLKKWRGLRPVVLKRHGLTFSSGVLKGRDGILYIDERSCACCLRYLARDQAQYDDCRACPLCHVLGRPCDATTVDGNKSEYEAGCGGDPEPMIQALTRAQRLAQKGVKQL